MYLELSMKSPDHLYNSPGAKNVIRDAEGNLIKVQYEAQEVPAPVERTAEQIKNNKEALEKYNQEEIAKKESSIIEYPEKKRSLVESLGGSIDELKRRTQPIRDKISSMFSEKPQKIDHESEIPMKNNFEKPVPSQPSPEDHQRLLDELNEYREKGYLDKEKSFFTNDSSKTLELGSVFDRIEMSKKNSDPEVVASAGRALLDLEKAYNNPDDKNGQKKILDTYEMIRKDLVEGGLPVNQTFESILNNRMRTESENERGKSEQNFTIPETPSPAPDSAMPDDRAERFMQLRNRFDIIVADNRLQDYDFMKKYDVHEMLPAAFEKDTREGLIALAEFDVEAGRIKRSPVGPMEKRKQLEALGEKFVNDVFAKANKDTI